MRPACSLVNDKVARDSKEVRHPCPRARIKIKSSMGDQGRTIDSGIAKTCRSLKTALASELEAHRNASELLLRIREFRIRLR